MSRIALSLLAAVVAILGGTVGSTWAIDWTAIPLADQDVYASTSSLPLIEISDCDGSCAVDDGCCGCCDCYTPGLIATAEAVFFDYGRADGTRVGVALGEDVETNYTVTPRLTLGWVAAGGLGARVRYWLFDQEWAATEGGLSELRVDTQTIDFELFERFALNDVWGLEASLGLRYNDFNETLIDDGDIRINEFNGVGGVVGAELRRLVGRRGAIFAGARGAMIMDDKRIFNNDVPPIQNVELNNVTVGMMELAFGYEYVVPLNCGACFFVRGQAEWQNWFNYSSAFTDLNNAERFAGASDVSFQGFGISVGLAR